MKKLLQIPLMVGLCVLSSQTVANDINSIVTQKAIEHKVPPALAHALIKTESNYDSNARNGSSMGLGQIQCRTAKGLGFNGDCRQLYNPNVNLEYSMKYLKLALNRSNGNMCYALTLYNRGLGNKPGSSEYCKKVLAKIIK